MLKTRNTLKFIIFFAPISSFRMFSEPKHFFCFIPKEH